MTHGNPNRIVNALLAAVLAVSLTTPIASAMEYEVLFETVLDGYLLGSGQEIVVDDEQNIFVAAMFQGDRNDIVFAKMDASGGVLWQVILEGNEIDIASALAIDNAGNLLVAGYTDSSDFPTTADALYPNRIAHRDAFLLKLASADGALLYGTYLGGDHSDQADALVIADDGTIYLAGVTDSPDFPTVNPLQATLANPPYQFNDAFVTRLSADARTILYSTYLGASRDDAALGIGIQPNGEIVVAGVTDSTDFAMVEGLQMDYAGGFRDAFAVVLSADGSSVVASTYLGGEDWDQVWGFATGPGGAVFISGWTESVGFPTSANAVQPAFAGEVNGCETTPHVYRNCRDGWLVRLTPNLDNLVYGTYLGGDRDDEIRDVAVDRHGRASVAGYTFSSDFPITSGTAGAAMFAAKFGPAGRHMDFAFGIDAGGSSNAGHGVAVDPNGASIYVTGARNVPADVFVSRIGVDGLLFADPFESATLEVWGQMP